MPPLNDVGLVDARASGPPATHALVIGVGKYPHLLGGTGPRLPDHQGLGQLSSPPASARAIATWLIDGLHNPSRPLGSVRLLVSEADPQPFTNPTTGQAHAVTPATIANVAEACRAWRAGGDEHPDNLLLFYFCGHGLATGAFLALLMEDFGADPDNALDGALDFHALHLGMNRCAAKQQCYLIDACRTEADMLLYSSTYAGRVVVQPKAIVGVKQRPVLYSTLFGQAAHGRQGQPSHFAEAVLAGFKGAGGSRIEGDWRVNTSSLHQAIEVHMARKVRAGLATAQIPPADHLTTFDLCWLRGPPKVPVIVECRPEAATPKAHFRCLANGATVEQRLPKPGAWELSLPVGPYDFEADFEDGSHPPARAPGEYVYPPQQKVPVEVGS